jgi:hypothetical protein
VITDRLDNSSPLIRVSLRLRRHFAQFSLRVGWSGTVRVIGSDIYAKDDSDSMKAMVSIYQGYYPESQPEE